MQERQGKVSGRQSGNAAALPRAGRAGAAARPPSPSRGRPRSQAARDAILKVSLRLIEREGYRALTIEKIAAEAGVGKQTIYRWWASKAEVVLEAYTAYAEAQVPLPDSGSLRADLEDFLCSMVRGFAKVSGLTVRALVAETLVNSEFRQAFQRIFLARRRKVLLSILRAAIARREIPEGTDLRLALDFVYGPVWHRVLHQQAPLSRLFAKQLAALVVAALKLARGETSG